MKKNLLVIVGLGALLVVGVLVGRPALQRAMGGPSAAYVDPAYAEKMDMYLAAAPIDRKRAAVALEEARKMRPTNGYIDYLRASDAAQDRDLVNAIKYLEAGNQAPEVIHYIAEEPAHENQRTLSRLRHLTDLSDDVAAKPESEPFLLALRATGYRVIRLEPITSLSVAGGLSLLKQVYADAENNPKIDQKTWAAEAKALREWDTVFKEEYRQLMPNIYRKLGEDAGLTESEIADVAKMKPLADSGKQAKVEEMARRVVAEEQIKLRELVAKLPVPG
jgi:hypothetical protein